LTEQNEPPLIAEQRWFDQNKYDHKTNDTINNNKFTYRFHQDVGLGIWPVIPYIPPFSFPVGLSYEFTIHLINNKYKCK
jgi:hypothetical protein